MNQENLTTVSRTEENEAAVIRALSKLKSNAFDKRVDEMGRCGYFDLSYANCYANKIRSLCQIEKAEPIIENIVFVVVSELVRYLTSRDIEPYDIRQFAKRIIHDFGGVLTISGVAHWVYLVQGCKAPFHEEIKGFDRRKLISLLRLYIDKQNEWRMEKERLNADQNGEIACLAERNRLIASAMKQNPEIKNKIKELREKLEAKYPARDNRSQKQKLWDLHTEDYKRQQTKSK